jgi:hypothetical protein
MRALELLLPVLTSAEPAEGLRSFMWPSQVQHNGGCALLRICSDARCAALGPVAPVFRVNNGVRERVLAGSIGEALRRARVLAAQAPTSRARAMLLAKLEAVEWPWDIRAPLFEEL